MSRARVGSGIMLLGVDVGGTFTDAVLAFDGGLVTAKSVVMHIETWEPSVESV